MTDLDIAQRKIFIGGLSYVTDDDKLRRYFSSYGSIQDAVVMKDPETKRSRGFGFITFGSRYSVDKVLENEPHFIDSRKVEAKRAVPKAETSPPGVTHNSQTSRQHQHLGAGPSTPPYTRGTAATATATATSKISSALPQGVVGNVGTNSKQCAANAGAVRLPVDSNPAAFSSSIPRMNSSVTSDASTGNKLSAPSNTSHSSSEGQSPRTFAKKSSPSQSAMNSRTVAGDRISPDYSYNKIFVGGLHYETRDAEFRQYFEKFGKVMQAEVMFNRETHKSRGFGFIVFESEKSAEAVCASDVGEHYIDEKLVEVKRAIPRSRLASMASAVGSKLASSTTTLVSSTSLSSVSSGLAATSNSTTGIGAPLGHDRVDSISICQQSVSYIAALKSSGSMHPPPENANNLDRIYIVEDDDDFEACRNDLLRVSSMPSASSEIDDETRAATAALTPVMRALSASNVSSHDGNPARSPVVGSLLPPPQLPIGTPVKSKSYPVQSPPTGNAVMAITNTPSSATVASFGLPPSIFPYEAGSTMLSQPGKTDSSLETELARLRSGSIELSTSSRMSSRSNSISLMDPKNDIGPGTTGIGYVGGFSTPHQQPPIGSISPKVSISVIGSNINASKSPGWLGSSSQTSPASLSLQGIHGGGIGSSMASNGWLSPRTAASQSTEQSTGLTNDNRLPLANSSVLGDLPRSLSNDSEVQGAGSGLNTGKSTAWAELTQASDANATMQGHQSQPSNIIQQQQHDATIYQQQYMNMHQHHQQLPYPYPYPPAMFPGQPLPFHHPSRLPPPHMHPMYSPQYPRGMPYQMGYDNAMLYSQGYGMPQGQMYQNNMHPGPMGYQQHCTSLPPHMMGPNNGSFAGQHQNSYTGLNGGGGEQYSPEDQSYPRKTAMLHSSESDSNADGAYRPHPDSFSNASYPSFGEMFKSNS